MYRKRSWFIPICVSVVYWNRGILECTVPHKTTVPWSCAAVPVAVERSAPTVQIAINLKDLTVISKIFALNFLARHTF